VWLFTCRTMNHFVQIDNCRTVGDYETDEGPIPKRWGNQRVRLLLFLNEPLPGSSPGLGIGFVSFRFAHHAMTALSSPRQVLSGHDLDFTLYSHGNQFGELMTLDRLLSHLVRADLIFPPDVSDGLVWFREATGLYAISTIAPSMWTHELPEDKLGRHQLVRR